MRQSGSQILLPVQIVKDLVVNLLKHFKLRLWALRSRIKLLSMKRKVPILVRKCRSLWTLRELQLRPFGGVWRHWSNTEQAETTATPHFWALVWVTKWSCPWSSCPFTGESETTSPQPTHPKYPISPPSSSCGVHSPPSGQLPTSPRSSSNVLYTFANETTASTDP